MASRTFITARQRRFGAELRRMREQTGLTIQEAADRLGTNRSHVTNMELARFGVSPERLRALAALYSCPDDAYVEALAAMAAERTRGWWEDYRGYIAAAALDLAELEHHAVSIRCLDVMQVPGLLQTEDYARAIHGESVPAWSPTELRRRISYRLRRRDVLDREDPPPCTFLIHEAGLHMRFGEPKVLRAQLDRILEDSERANVTVRVIPFTAGGLAVPGLQLMYTTGPIPQLDTAQSDSLSGSMLFDAETQLANFRSVLARTTKAALSVRESRDFLRTLAADIKS